MLHRGHRESLLDGLQGELQNVLEHRVASCRHVCRVVEHLDVDGQPEALVLVLTSCAEEPDGLGAWNASILTHGDHTFDFPVIYEGFAPLAILAG